MGVELRDQRGLICGFRLQAEGPAVAIEIADIDPPRPPDAPLWVHFNLNDTRGRRWIDDCDWLSAEIREHLLSNERGARLELMGDGFAAVLADLFSDDPDSFGVVRLYVDKNCLITGRNHSVASVAALRQTLLRGAPAATTTALVNYLLAHLVAGFAKRVAEFGDLIDDAEEHVFGGHFQETQLGPLRRAMAHLRRQIGADRHALLETNHHLPSWWDKASAKALRETLGDLSTVAQDLEFVQERARLLGEEIDSRIAGRTNRNLYFVSLAAAVFLPITLISGIFGMNVGGLPWVETDHGFLWTIACMGGAIFVTFVVMYWRRML